MTYTLTREQSRQLDRRAIDECGIPGMVLMENAGRGTVDVLERLGISGPVVILCGKGNNAGDGFVIARHLEIRGHAAKVLLLFPPSELTGDAATNFAILETTNVPIVELAAERAGSSPTPDVLMNQLAQNARGADWLVDAMLGTGARGEPRPPFDAAIDWMNAQPARKLAVDLPSGLDCDTGEPAVHTVRADHTCTFAAMKIGFTKSAAKEFTGTIHVCDVGVPPRLLQVRS
jgi:NAD(P)H-hydrate epimerase